MIYSRVSGSILAPKMYILTLWMMIGAIVIEADLKLLIAVKNRWIVVF